VVPGAIVTSGSGEIEGVEEDGAFVGVDGALVGALVGSWVGVKVGADVGGWGEEVE
jgi:hypothetical protein